MRAFLKFLINMCLLALLVWIVVRFTTLDDKIIEFFTKKSGSTTSVNASCTTPWGVNIPNGSSVFAYQSQYPNEQGSCVEEQRTCSNGSLNGSYEYGSCHNAGTSNSSDSGTSTGWTIPAVGKACITPRGQSIEHGNYIVSYESPSSCRFQRRMCVDGQLLGKFMYNYCMIAYNGDSYSNNGIEGNIGALDSSTTYQDLDGYSNEVNGSQSNPAGGSRQYTPINYGGNVANRVLPNDYWNQNMKGSIAVTNTSKTPYNPLATNGIPSYNGPKDWRRNDYTHYDLTLKGCSTPWGSFVDHGQYVIAYKTATATSSHSCEYERRNCYYGKLNGSFSYPSCSYNGVQTYTYNTPQSANQGYDNYYRTNDSTQTTTSTKSCRTPWGSWIADGQYTRGYKYSSAPWSDGCEGEIRYCHNGVLDGSYSNQSCTLKDPTYNGCYGRQCGSWNNACSLPRGGSISHGQSVIAYRYLNGQCYSETRTCSNGRLQGGYTDQYCQNYNNNNACSLPRGGILANGQSVTAYRYLNGQCYSETRYCSNGGLQGSYTDQYCQNNNNYSCSLPRGGTIANTQSVTAYKYLNGQCYSETRYCSNGSLNGSYTDQSCQSNGNYQSCSLPRGGSISHGQSVEAYSSSTSPCYKESRQCYNGVLNGSYGYASCNLGNGGSDTYGEWQDMGILQTAPDGSDTCHGDATATFTCQTQDALTCIDYRKISNGSVGNVGGRYEKRSVTCIR